MAKTKLKFIHSELKKSGRRLKGISKSVKIILTLVFIPSYIMQAQNTFEKIVGENDSFGFCVQQTIDNGYIIAGKINNTLA